LGHGQNRTDQASQQDEFFHGAHPPICSATKIGRLGSRQRNTSSAVAARTSDPMPASMIIAEARPTTSKQL
jgi:hypothetical protein